MKVSNELDTPASFSLLLKPLVAPLGIGLYGSTSVGDIGVSFTTSSSPKSMLKSPCSCRFRRHVHVIINLRFIIFGVAALSSHKHTHALQCAYIFTFFNNKFIKNYSSNTFRTFVSMSFDTLAVCTYMMIKTYASYFFFFELC